MQDQLIIFDTTMRDGEQSPGAAMSRDDNVRIGMTGRSATTPRSPSLANVAEMPMTASAPNQVAKTVAMTIGTGRLRPAIAKSLVLWTRVAARRPMLTEIKR